jgi:hypothetical protein
MEDSIHRRIQKLQLFLESMQEELLSLTQELNQVTITNGRPVSSLTQQFNMLKSPSETPNPRQYKKRDRKQTPAFVRQVQEVEEDARERDSATSRVPSAQPNEKRRLKPTLIPKEDTPGNLELHRGYAIGPDYKKLEQEWRERRQQTLDTQQPLETLAQPKEYNEVTTSDDENGEEKQDLFLPSFKFKAKGFSKENTKQWIQRLYREAILKGVNPLLKKEGLEFLFVKLGRVKKGFQVTQKEINDAAANISMLRSLFQRLVRFIDEPKASNMRM